jgi:signal peptidase I
MEAMRWLMRLGRPLLLVRVFGDSMAPSYRHGDRLLATRLWKCLHRGDVLIFRVTAEDYGFAGGDAATISPDLRLKRIAACAGEPAPDWLDERLRSKDGLVPRGYVAVAGDAANSEGSQQLGYIAEHRIEAVVLRRLCRPSER